MLDQKQHKALKEEIINKFGHSFKIIEKPEHGRTDYIIKEVIGNNYETLEKAKIKVIQEKYLKIEEKIKEYENSLSSHNFLSKILSKSEIEEIQHKIEQLKNSMNSKQNEEVHVEYLNDKYYFYPVINFETGDDIYLAILTDVPNLKQGKINQYKATLHASKDNLINVLYEVSLKENNKKSDYYFYSKPDDLFSKIHLEIKNDNGIVTPMNNPDIYIFKDKIEAIKFINGAIEDKIKRLHEAKIPEIDI